MKPLSENAREAYSLMTGMGYKPHVAAALVGNMMQESGWDINTRAVGDGGNAFGSVQWNGPRRRAYMKWARDNGLRPDDLKAQVSYLHHELGTTEKRARDAILSAPDLQSATLAASEKFWRPGDPRNENRVRYAQAVASQLSDGGEDQPASQNDDLQRQNVEAAKAELERRRNVAAAKAELERRRAASAQTSIPQEQQADVPEEKPGFMDRLRTSLSAVANDFNAGLQGVSPRAREDAELIGVMAAERGDPSGLNAFVQVQNTDMLPFLPELDPGGRLPLDALPADKVFTAVGEDGLTRVYVRKPEHSESRLLSAGRVIGLGASSVAPVGAATRAPAAVSETAEAAAKRLGVTPSAGMAGALAGRVASVGESSMITGGTFRRDAKRAVDELAGARERIAAGVGSGTEAAHGGNALASGADNYLQWHLKGENSVSQRLSRRLDSLVPGETPVSVAETGQKLKEFLTKFPNLENTARDLGIAKWQGWLDDIERAGGSLRWDEVRALRSSIGQAVGKISGPLADRAGGEIKQLYGALSKDLEATAKATGPAAYNAWKVFNKHYAESRRMVDEVLDIVSASKTGNHPERAFEALYSLGRDKGGRANIQRLREIKKAMPADAWGETVSSIIRMMGNGPDGFSPARYMTEWGKISPQAKRVFFGGDKVPQGLLREMNDLALVAERSRGAEQLINHSRSGANMINFATGTGAAGALASGNVVTIALAAAGVTSALATAKAMTSPPILRAVRNYVAAGGTPGALRNLRDVVAKNAQVLGISGDVRAIGTGAPGSPESQPTTGQQ